VPSSYSRARSRGWSPKGSHSADVQFQLVYFVAPNDGALPFCSGDTIAFGLNVEPPWDGRDVVHRHSRCPRSVTRSRGLTRGLDWSAHRPLGASPEPV